MADVVDIIHRLSYEADTDVIESINAEFGVQLKQLEALRAKEAQYAQQLEKTGKDNIDQQRILTGLIAKTKAEYDKVTIAIGKQAAENEKLASGIKRTAGNLQNLSFAGSQLLREAPAFTYSIQTGILALSNNIPILVDQITAARKAGSTTTEVFKALGNSIFSISGLLTIAVSALTIFGGQLFDTGEDAKKAEDKIKDLTSSLDDYIKKIQEVNKISQSNRFGLNIAGASEADLQRELELLKARGASADLIALKEKEISANRQKSLTFLQGELKTALDYLEQRRQAILNGERAPGAPALSPELANLIKGLDPLKAEPEIRKRYDEINNLIANEENKRDVITANRERERLEEQKKANEKALRERERYIKKIKDQFDSDNPLRFDPINASGSSGPERISDADAYLNSVNDSIKRRFKLEEDARKRDKQIIDDSLNYAYNTTVQTLQSIYDAQLFYLDKEIALRRERVDQAVLLAEKGNTDILAAEQNRLRKTEEERERVAERQLQLNALLQASSAAIAATQAIQVVTNAGATGDPYSTAARIAAAVAALAAGFAFVTSLTQAFKFADGVIDLNGPGTERSDSIPARLSRGESVMTAAETREFKPYLEAMRDGNFYNMIANTAQPVFVQGNNYGKLEKKLDGVIAAVEGIHISANQKMDKNGISQAIESYKRQEGNRWR